MPTELPRDLEGLLAQIEKTPDYVAMKRAGPQSPESLLWQLASCLQRVPESAQAACTLAALALRHVVIDREYHLTWYATPEIRTAVAEQADLHAQCAKVVRLLSPAAGESAACLDAAATRREIWQLVDYFHRLSGGMPANGPGGGELGWISCTLESIPEQISKVLGRVERPEHMHFHLLHFETHAGRLALAAAENQMIEGLQGRLRFYRLMRGTMGDRLTFFWRFCIIPFLQSATPNVNPEASDLLFPRLLTDGQGRALGKDGKPFPWRGHWSDKNGKPLANVDAKSPPPGARWELDGRPATAEDHYDSADALEHLRTQARDLADACRALARMIREKAHRETVARRVITPAPPEGKSLRTLAEEGGRLLKKRCTRDWRILEVWAECATWAEQVAQTLPSEGLRTEWEAVAVLHPVSEDQAGAMLTEYMQKRLTWLGQKMQSLGVGRDSGHAREEGGGLGVDDLRKTEVILTDIRTAMAELMSRARARDRFRKKIVAYCNHLVETDRPAAPLADTGVATAFGSVGALAVIAALMKVGPQDLDEAYALLGAIHDTGPHVGRVGQASPPEWDTEVQTISAKDDPRIQDWRQHAEWHRIMDLVSMPPHAGGLRPEVIQLLPAWREKVEADCGATRLASEEEDTTRYLLMVRYPVHRVVPESGAEGIGKWQEGGPTPFYSTCSEEAARRIIARFVANCPGNEDQPADAETIKPPVHPVLRREPYRDPGKGVYRLVRETELDASERAAVQVTLSKINVLANGRPVAFVDWPDAMTRWLIADHKRAIAWEEGEDFFARVLSLTTPPVLDSSEMARLIAYLKRPVSMSMQQRAARGDVDAAKERDRLTRLKEVRAFNSALAGQIVPAAGNGQRRSVDHTVADAAWQFDELPAQHDPNLPEQEVRARNQALCREYATLDMNDLLVLCHKWRSMAIGFVNATKENGHYHGHVLHDAEIEKVTRILETAIAARSIEGVNRLGRCLRRPDDGHLHHALATLDELEARLRTESAPAKPANSPQAEGNESRLYDALSNVTAQRSEILTAIRDYANAERRRIAGGGTTTDGAPPYNTALHAAQAFLRDYMCDLPALTVERFCSDLGCISLDALDRVLLRLTDKKTSAAKGYASSLSTPPREERDPPQPSEKSGTSGQTDEDPAPRRTVSAEFPAAAGETRTVAGHAASTPGGDEGPIPVGMPLRRIAEIILNENKAMADRLVKKWRARGQRHNFPRPIRVGKRGGRAGLHNPLAVLRHAQEYGDLEPDADVDTLKRKLRDIVG